MAPTAKGRKFHPLPAPQTNTPLPKMGVLHPSYMPAIAAAVKKIRP